MFLSFSPVVNYACFVSDFAKYVLIVWLYFPFALIFSFCQCSLCGGYSIHNFDWCFSKLDTNWCGCVADKCWWCEEELLPWWQAATVARRDGAPQLVAWYSSCWKPWSNGAVNLHTSRGPLYVNFTYCIWHVDFNWRTWNNSCQIMPPQCIYVFMLSLFQFSRMNDVSKQWLAQHVVLVCY